MAVSLLSALQFAPAPIHVRPVHAGIEDRDPALRETTRAGSGNPDDWPHKRPAPTEMRPQPAESILLCRSSVAPRSSERSGTVAVSRPFAAELRRADPVALVRVFPSLPPVPPARLPVLQRSSR